MIVLILLSSLVLCRGNGYPPHRPDTHEKGVYQVPKILGKWTPATASDLICPGPGEQPDMHGYFIRSALPHFQEDHHEVKPVEGYLCLGLKYTTHCSEGFFGGKTITRKITHYHPSDLECQEALNLESQGSLPRPYFPAESCVWMGEQEDTIQFRQLTPHRVTFDPYGVGFSDPLFKKQICLTHICETVHESTKWVTHLSYLKICSPFKEYHAIVYHNQDWSKIYLYPYTGKYLTVHDACLMSYCGQKGIRVSSGVFIGNLEKLLTQRLRPCPEGVNVTYQPLAAEILELSLEVRDDRDRIACLEAVRHIKTSRSTTFHELSLLEPKVAGFHRVYRLNKGKLEQAKGFWNPLKSFLMTQPNQLGQNFQNDSVFWTDWVPSGIPGLLSGFNGVHKNENTSTIIIPRLELVKWEYDQSIMTQLDLEEIGHPIIHQLEEEGLDSDLDTLSGHNTIDVEGWITRVWNNFWGKIGLVIACVVGVVILLFCLKLCFPILKKLCHCKPKSRSSSTPQEQQFRTEMLIMSPSRRVYRDNPQAETSFIEESNTIPLKATGFWSQK